MKKILVLTTMFIGITICYIATASAVPLQTEKTVMNTDEINEELIISETSKPSLSSGGLSQITEMMREIVRKEQRKQEKEIQKNNIGQEKS